MSHQALSLCLEALAAELATFPQQLGLYPVAIPPEFAHAAGVIGEMPIVMETQRYAAPWLEHFTLAVLRDAHAQVLSVTVSAVPHCCPLPILGLDYVAFRGMLSLVALDLCPTDQGFWQAYAAAPLAHIHLQAQGLTARKVPTFTRGIFSPHAVFAAARPGQESVALDLAQQLLTLYLELPRMSLADSEQADLLAMTLRWRLAMRQNKKEQQALARIFGEDYAHRYLDDFLFAVPRG